MTRYTLRVGLFALAVAAGPATARAADAAGDNPDGPSAPWFGGSPSAHFEKGSWSFQAYGGYLNDLGPYDTEGGFGTVGVGYYLFDNVSLSAEFSGYALRQPGDDAAAFGAGVTMRHHLLNYGRSSFFVDVAFSAVQASENVPHGGTSFNFITQTGVGAAHHLSGNTHLLLGVRYIHLSNADREGDDRNPSINGVSPYVGLMFCF